MASASGKFVRHICFLISAGFVVVQASLPGTEQDAEKQFQAYQQWDTHSTVVTPGLRMTLTGLFDRDLRRMQADMQLPFQERIILDLTYGSRMQEGRALVSFGYGARFISRSSDSSVVSLFGGFKKEALDHEDIYLRRVSVHGGATRELNMDVRLTGTLVLDYYQGRMRGADGSDYPQEQWPVSMVLGLDKGPWSLGVKFNGDLFIYSMGWTLWL